MQDIVPQNDHILNKIVLSENTDDYLIPDNSVLLLVLTVTIINKVILFSLVFFVWNIRGCVKP
jgi:hypothetical protein